MMQIKRQIIRNLAFIVFGCAVMLYGYGCQQHTKNGMHEFLFPAEPNATAASEKDAEKPEAAPNEGQAAGEVEPDYLLVSHKPYLERKCVECHSDALAFSTPIFGVDWDGVFRKGGGKPGPLLLPIEELCLKCHKDLSAQWAEERGLTLHTTAREGQCVKCHMPHQSHHPFRLVADQDQLCGRCHNAEQKPGIPKCVKDLQVTGPCLSCHNAHLGVNKALLTEDYAEPEHTVSLKGESNGESLSPVDEKTQQ